MTISPTPNMIAEKVGAVGRLVFNKPAKRNATSTDMWEAIPVILDEFEKERIARLLAAMTPAMRATSASRRCCRTARSSASVAPRWMPPVSTCWGWWSAQRALSPSSPK